MKNILTAALVIAASVCPAFDPGVDAARRGVLTSNHSVVTNVSAVRLVGPLADTPLVEGPRTNRLLTTASAGVRNPFALRYGLASSYMAYVGSATRGLFFGDGLSFSSDGTDGTVSVDSAYLGGLGFAKAADVTAALSRKQGSLSPAQLAAADSGVTAAKVASYDAHVADAAGHVTAAQKAEWSAKQDALTPAQAAAVDSGITAEELSHLHNHRVDRTVHINDEFLALNADKSYVDAKVGGVETAISDATNKAANAQQRLYGTSSFRRIRDFLYEADVDRLFPDFAEAWIASNYSPGACTSFRAGSLHCRNYDWTYSDLATVVVRTGADVGRHAAIAVSGAVPGLTDAFCASVTQSDMYKVLPYRVVDGINDAGLAVSVNVVPGTHAEVRHTFPGAPVSVCAVAVVRHVLDSYATAAEAAFALTNGTVDVWLPDPSASKYAYHWLLSDRMGSKVVELGDGTVWALDADAMTNFRLRGCSFDAEGHVVATSVERYGNGLERYGIVADGRPAAADAASAMSLLRSLRYTRLYTETSSPWYTELCGESPELTVTADRALFGPFLGRARELYADRTRESGTTWQTVHSAVYDLSSRKLTLSVQEEYGVSYEFSFPGGDSAAGKVSYDTGAAQPLDTAEKILESARGMLTATNVDELAAGAAERQSVVGRLTDGNFVVSVNEGRLVLEDYGRILWECSPNDIISCYTNRMYRLTEDGFASNAVTFTNLTGVSTLTIDAPVEVNGKANDFVVYASVPENGTCDLSLRGFGRVFAKDAMAIETLGAGITVLYFTQFRAGGYYTLSRQMFKADVTQ